MTKIYNLLSYYILLLLSLITTSWIIWSRFIRNRIIREIPDVLLTEYRFWILIYIRCIYLFVIKSLIKERKPNIFLSILSKIITIYLWKPLTTLDHFIKYNAYNKIFYYHFMMNFMKSWDKLSITWHKGIIVSFQVIPRIILVIFLTLDTFYFNKLELFYKVVLIGILPFMFKYIEYSFNDFYEHLIKQLTDKYNKVQIFEKGYEGDISHKSKTKALWHLEWVSIEEYIEILFDTYCENLQDQTSYEYVGKSYCKEEIYKKYERQFNKLISAWTFEDFEKVNLLFQDLMPQILNLKITLYIFHTYKKEKKIIGSKIAIFSIYLICWAYILVISYYNFPIELPMFKYFITAFMAYLTIEDNLFIDSLHSLSQNLITIHSIKNLILNIINNIIK